LFFFFFLSFSLSLSLLQDSDMTDDSGWKQVSADVFRPPAHLELLASALGSGAQLCLLVLVVIVFAAASTWEVSRGRMFTAVILWYALTSFAAGYVGGGFYARCGGLRWIRTMLMTATLVPGNVFGTVAFLNAVAGSYGSLARIPFGTIVSVVLIWAFLSLPLTLMGTIVGRNWAGVPDVPRRVNVIPRDIPEKPWCVGGFFFFVLFFLIFFFPLSPLGSASLFFVYFFFFLQ
jgi:transmembrane 9 superfamily protein 3